MRLFEAIIDANHRALTGDASAGVQLADYAGELPIVALTCIDPRLNPLFPNVLGVNAENFIWLRNAGNIISSPMSSTMRSLALACAVKGGREIAIIGHTDCGVRKTSSSKLIDSFRHLGIDRAALPENLNEFFNLFASEQQNVLKAVDFVRHSPLIGPKVPVQGLIVDVNTGRLDWVVNGYRALEMAPPASGAGNQKQVPNAAGPFQDFKIGEMKFPEIHIGETVSVAGQPSVSAPVSEPDASQRLPQAPPPVSPPPHKIPLPPRIRPAPFVQPWKRRA